MRNQRMWWTASSTGLAIMLALLAGCTAMLPKLAAPRLYVSSVQLGPTVDMRQQVQLTLHAVNPNDRAIAIRSIDCQLDLENMQFAQGATEEAFTLPANGEIDFTLNVTADLNTALVVLAGGLGHHTVNYRLYGQIHLKGSLLRSIPFDQKGRVKL